jgi:hypothetical protein
MPTLQTRLQGVTQAPLLPDDPDAPAGGLGVLNQATPAQELAAAFAVTEDLVDRTKADTGAPWAVVKELAVIKLYARPEYERRLSKLGKEKGADKKLIFRNTGELKEEVERLCRELEAVQARKETQNKVENGLPRVYIDQANRQIAIREIQGIFKSTGGLFCRAVPVCVALNPEDNTHYSHQMAADDIVLKAHEVSRPWGYDKDGEEVDKRFPAHLQ